MLLGNMSHRPYIRVIKYGSCDTTGSKTRGRKIVKEKNLCYHSYFFLHLFPKKIPIAPRKPEESRKEKPDMPVVLNLRIGEVFTCLI